MPFGITPANNPLPVVDQGFPRFIQFQQDGVNLGGPDADTVNFLSGTLTAPGIVAVRGTSGGDENTITVTTPEV